MAKASPSPFWARSTSSLSPGWPSARGSSLRVSAGSDKGRVCKAGGEVGQGTQPGPVPSLGEDLVRIQEPFRIEGLLEPLLPRDPLGLLLASQVGPLGRAHAVLAGDGAAQVDGRLQEVDDRFVAG